MQKDATTAASENVLTLSRKEAVILELLLSSKMEMFGLEMVDASNGALKRGTIYVTLQRMKEKGFLDSKPEPRSMPEIGIPRRLYRATGLGERALNAHRAARAIWIADLGIANA
jgi:PadR family transcriptional regulator, regulatory protein PadR